MKILAIDTSSKNAVVAITENEEALIELNNDDEKTHSQKLMPMIDETFKSINLSLNDIDLITCCLGPGSFTGVRIGIATAKAFCDTKKVKAIGVNSLESLAYNLKICGYVCSIIDAGHGNCYAGIFKILEEEGNLKTVFSHLEFLNIEEMDSFLSKNVTEKEEIIHFVGDGAIAYEKQINALEKKYNIAIANASCYKLSGITLAKLGYNKYKNGEAGNSSVLSPIYLRKSQAELALEEKNKN